ncbi:TPA: hypothetical protein L3N15_004160 [Vibrio parahaemolyticus]|nr:hypothetical protein [Vibrio parahaemolyticus]
MTKFELKAVVKVSKIEEVLHSQTRDRFALLLDDHTRIDVSDDFQCKYEPRKGDLLVRFDIPDQENEDCCMVMKKDDFNKFTIIDHHDRDASQPAGDLVKEHAEPVHQQKSKYPIELDGGRLVYPAVLRTYDDKGNILEVYPVTSEMSAAIIERLVGPSVAIDEVESEA